MADPFIGQICMFAGTYVPKGYAECNGQLMNINDNEALYSLLGTQFGGDGRTTFALPDYRGRIPVGVGTGPGLTPINYGQRGGLEAVILTDANLPVHTHIMEASKNAADSNEPTGRLCAVMDQAAQKAAYKAGNPGVELPDDTIGNTGNSQPHSNMMPYMTIRFFIAIKGLYPSRN